MIKGCPEYRPSMRGSSHTGRKTNGSLPEKPLKRVITILKTEKRVAGRNTSKKTEPAILLEELEGGFLVYSTTC